MKPVVLTISEARRRLPTLVRNVARGGGPVLIGPRGEPTAVLVDPVEYESLRLRAADRVGERTGWRGAKLEVVGPHDDFAQALRDVRAEAIRHFEGWRYERAAGSRLRKAPRARKKART